MRRAITGGPKTGKTTLSSPHALHTDDLISMGKWSDHSRVAAEWFNRPDKNLEIEGAIVPRALRKWLADNPTGRPIDHLVVLTTPHAPLSHGQVIMTKGINTVLAEIMPELRRRGVQIVSH